MYWMRHIFPAEVEAYEQRLIPFLRRLEPGMLGRLSAEDIIRMAKESRLFFDLMMDVDDQPVVLFVLEIVNYPKAVSLRLMSAVGDIGDENMDSAIDFIDSYFTRLARQMRYDFIEYEGRKGWIRLMKRRGVQFTEHAVAIKRIEADNEDSHAHRLSNDSGPDEIRASRG